jgi:hypothetical protein
MRRAMAHDSADRVRDGSRWRGLALSPRPLYPPKADRSRAVERELESLSAKFGFRTETEAESRSIQALSDLSCEITGRLCLAGWTP